MKYIIFFLLVVSINLSCSETRKGSVIEQLPPDKIEANSTEGIEQTDNFPQTASHYAALFQFTEEKMTLTSVEKVVGDFPLLIAPAFDAFVATYKGEKILSFYAFPNPMEVKQGRSETGAAAQTLLFPASLADTKMFNDIYIGVYKVTNYIEDWESKVKTRAQLQQSVKDGFLKELYTLDSKPLSKSLQQAK